MDGLAKSPVGGQHPIIYRVSTIQNWWFLGFRWPIHSMVFLWFSETVFLWFSRGFLGTTATSTVWFTRLPSISLQLTASMRSNNLGGWDLKKNTCSIHANLCMCIDIYIYTYILYIYIMAMCMCIYIYIYIHICYTPQERWFRFVIVWTNVDENQVMNLLRWFGRQEAWTRVARGCGIRCATNCANRPTRVSIIYSK